MVDIARLGFAVDSDQIEKGVAALNKLGPAAAKAEAAAQGVAGASSKMGGALNAAAAGLPGLGSNVNRAAAGMTNLQSALASVANASNLSARASLAAGTSMGNGVAQVMAAAAGHVRFQDEIKKSTKSVLLLNDSMMIVPKAANEAGGALDRLGKHASDNINRMQATPGNIAAQFQDIGVTAAGGMSPLLIAMQQGTQLGAAMSGGMGNLLAAFKQLFSPINLLAIGFTALIAYAIQWGIAAFSASDKTDKLTKALNDAKLASNNLSDGQSILGNMFDLTTGKIKDQTSATVALTRALVTQAKIAAETRQLEAENAMKKMTTQKWGVTTGMSSSGPVPIVKQFYGATAGIVDAFRKGEYSADKAQIQLERLMKIGQATKEEYLAASTAVVNFAVEAENIKRTNNMMSAVEGNKAALEPYLNRPKPPKGPKSDAEKLVDIFQGADADIATEKAREMSVAIGMNIDKAAALGQETKLLNTIMKQDIPITDAVIARVKQLAATYGQAKLAADTAEAFGKSINATDEERRKLSLQNDLIGKYGEELYKLKYIQDLITNPQQKGIVFKPEQIAELTKRAEGLAKAATKIDKKTFMEQMASDAEILQFQMERERGAFGLTGAAALQYTFVTERLLAAKRAHQDLLPGEIAAIDAAGAAYGRQKQAIDRMNEALAFTKETIKGVFTEWVANVRNGQNVFGAFADSILNALNKIIDKALDMALNGMLDAVLGGSSGGLFARMFGQGAPVAGGGLGLSSLTASGTGSVLANAKGNAFNDNGIVSTPTLFKFAKGTGLMGEAGPEAIMPLKRGADGALGVQMHDGGRGASQAPSVVIAGSTYNVGGVTTPAEIMSAIRQGDEQAKADLARAIPALLSEYQRNGTTG